MKKVSIVILAFLFLSMKSIAPMKKGDDANMVFKATYLYMFTKLVNWPKNYKKGEFVIGVVGNDDLYQHLTKKFGSRSVGSQKITIKKYMAESNINKCHLLYVRSEANNVNLSKMVNKTNNTSTLLVTEKKGAIEKGAVINFMIENNKLAYVLSKNNAKKRNLNLAGKLEDLASKVVK